MRLKRNIICLLLAMLFAVPLIQATTIQKFTFTDLVDLSALIIEGEVVEVSSVTKEELIYTRVLFRIDDVLKGNNPGEFVELDFLGGSQNGKVVSIAGQDIPEQGERGFYFIEDLSMKAVNPITGWSQGQFQIYADAKGNEILARDLQQEMKVITGLSQSKNELLAAKLQRMKFSSKLLDKAEHIPATPDEFREAVQRSLDGN